MSCSQKKTPYYHALCCKNLHWHGFSGIFHNFSESVLFLLTNCHDSWKSHGFVVAIPVFFFSFFFCRVNNENGPWVAINGRRKQAKKPDEPMIGRTHSGPRCYRVDYTRCCIFCCAAMPRSCVMCDTCCSVQRVMLQARTLIIRHSLTCFLAVHAPSRQGSYERYNYIINKSFWACQVSRYFIFSTSRYRLIAQGWPVQASNRSLYLQ